MSIATIQESEILNKKQLEVLSEYHLIHSKLRSETIKRNVKTMVCTSLENGEGATTTCGNLALLFAKEGNKVLVIDGNLWNPGIHHFFKVENEQGIVTYLRDIVAIEKCVQQHVVYQLDVLPSGTTGEQTNALYSLHFADLLVQLKKQYDYILIDTPPILESADAMFIANMCDGVVLACESERHSVKDLQRAKRVFEEGQLLGIVVTKVDNV